MIISPLCVFAPLYMAIARSYKKYTIHFIRIITPENSLLVASATVSESVSSKRQQNLIFLVIKRNDYIYIYIGVKY